MTRYAADRASRRPTPGPLPALVLLALTTCGGEVPGADVRYTEDRAPCADRTPLRRALFGDLHVHGAFSFDARNYGTLATPGDVLAFARGAELGLSPLDAEGRPTRSVRLNRPLDFAAVTEHGEMLGEIAHCTTPGSPGYDDPLCAAYQGGEDNAAFDFGLMLAAATPRRDPELCGADGAGCMSAARQRWQAVVDAAEDANDRTAACTFSAFVGYEYTRSTEVNNLHRNLIFRNGTVPDLPVTSFEAAQPWTLREGIRDLCLDAGTGCDAMAIPHNSNLSSGRMFHPSWIEEAGGDPVQRVALRARLEPVVEIMQHKGQSECRNGHGAPDDPGCTFEQQRPPDDPVCGDAPGTGGMRLWGCDHRLDFVRAAFLDGLRLWGELGVNPYQAGVIGSTDTHNGTAGLVRTVDFPGHVGAVDDTPVKRLGEGTITHDAFINNPGGLAGVWAVENSRDAIFEALRRREVFATSGPRIQVRLFVGDLDADLCGRDDAVERAYRDGVPMGGVIDAVPAGGLRVWVQAIADDGQEEPVGLDRIQLIKGWIDADGAPREQVIDLVTGEGAHQLDPQTCAASGGAPSLCATWLDPDVDPTRPAFWYARVLEVPTCRWSARECNAFPEAERPPRCMGTWVEPVVQQRAWSSPVWFEPR